MILVQRLVQTGACLWSRGTSGYWDAETRGWASAGYPDCMATRVELNGRIFGRRCEGMWARHATGTVEPLVMVSA